MNGEELIEVLREFEEKGVLELPENARNLFYAIMKIADERDKYKNIIKEVREYIKEHTTSYYTNVEETNEEFELICDPEELLEILDKERSDING